MPRLIVVEDDARARASFAAELRDAGHEVVCAASAEEAAPALRDDPAADLLLVDVRLPGHSGIDLVRELAAAGRLPPTIVISGEATISETVEALRLGVFDFIEKPFSRERLRTSVRNALGRAALESELRALRSAAGDGEILGRSPATAALRERVARTAAADSTVLILGESGSGKELVAEAVHRLGPRRNGPFIKVNCAAISASLVEDELFGHVRGAFTDARAARPGLFEEAHGGTLFLDEVGDMDLGLQARLLRVLEDRRVRRLGDTRDVEVDVRVIAATHRDLQRAAREEGFRGDLYFRLACLVLEVPPLRERTGDVALLARHFVDSACRRQRTRGRSLAESAVSKLEAYAWPGNVRELKHVCERAVVFGGDPITADDLALPSRPDTDDSGQRLLQPTTLPQLTLKELRTRCEREYILHVLETEGWNLSAAARALDLQRTYLHAKLAALGIVRPR